MQQQTKPPLGRVLWDYAVLLIMAVVMALNYYLLILSNAFAPSGLNGIATMLQYVFHFSIGYFSLIVNIPLAILCALMADRRFALRTLVFSLVFSGVLLLFQNKVIDLSKFVYKTPDGKSTLLAPVISGAINGFLYGMTIRHGASTGGTDFIAEIIHHKNPAYSLTHVVLIMNCVVAGISYFVYDYNIEPVALCIIYSLLTTSVSDWILQGSKAAVRVEMITAHPEEITQAIITELHHSATILQAVGGYSHQQKTLLVCVINRHQVTKMTEIISAFPDTFAVVSNVSETLGNFKKVKS